MSVIELSSFVVMSRHMDDTRAVEGLTALAQATRLSVFRHLVGRHPESVAAGELARFFEAPHNTMSTHLAVLVRAGLIIGSRQGRSMLYRADLDGFRDLVVFLIRDCCDRRPEICAPVLQSLPFDLESGHDHD